jgi:hypothetical protein
MIYDRTSISSHDLSAFENLYAPINVELIPSELIGSLRGENFDIIGLLGQSALDESRIFLEDFTCLKIGFYPANFQEHSPRSALRYLTAAITCLGSRSIKESLKTTIYHFFESLTLPSLLNIDLADVESIAHGTGVSFNKSGDSSEEIIHSLPPECYLARSALLHFTCERNVTLDEVYSISKTISTRRTIGPFVSDNDPKDQIKMYKRIRLKMGLRICKDAEKSGRRISLTGILFGIRA